MGSMVGMKKQTSVSSFLWAGGGFHEKKRHSRPSTLVSRSHWVLRSGRPERSDLAQVDVAQVSTDFEKEMWRSSLCQLPASENSLTLEFTDSRLVHVLCHSWALPTSVTGRPTTFANTSTQNSKFYSPFSLFYYTTLEKKALKKHLACGNHSHRGRDWLKVGYMANFGQESFFRVYHYNLVHQKEDFSKSICWKFEGNWTNWKRVM